MARWTAVVALAIGCSGHAPGGKGGDSNGGSDSGSDTSSADACTAEDIALDVGTGETAYESLTDGQQVTMNHGPQGGWHVWAGADLTHSEPEVSLHPVMTVPDLGDAQITGNQQASFVALTYDPAACHGQFWAMRAFIDTDADWLDTLCSNGVTAACGGDPQDLICSLVDHEAQLCLTAADIIDGRDATDCVTVTLEPDPIDVDDCSGTGTGS